MQLRVDAGLNLKE